MTSTGPLLTLSSDLPGAIGQSVRIAGWVHRLRELGGVTFMVVRDGAGLVQVVNRVSDPMLPDLTPETVVEVSGVVVAEARAPGGFEIHQPLVHVLDEPVEALPLHLGGPELAVGLDTRLNHAGLALRHPQVRRVFRVQAALAAGFRQALTDQNFVEVYTPKILGSATEGGANVFTLNYFDRDAFLAQSPQFYKQMLVGVFGRVFEVAPVFRAEPHDTGRHLSQYTSLDAEVGFIESHHTVMRILREALAVMMNEIERTVPDAPRLPVIPAEIPVIHFTEALARISDAVGQDVTGEPDLSPAHEAWLGEWARDEAGSEFLFVQGYPTVKRPFYTMPDPDRPASSRSFDLLFRGQEIVTGGQRLHRYGDYRAALAARGMAEAGLAGYLETFRCGMPPHGGFAIGLERLTARLMGLSNIREATLFPRDMKRLAP